MRSSRRPAAGVPYTEHDVHLPIEDVRGGLYFWLQLYLRAIAVSMRR
jgi:hypothetical protein